MARVLLHTNTRYRLATRRLIFVDTPFNTSHSHLDGGERLGAEIC